ncbi:MAG: DUF4830 domain-containing protein [Oscillospiraceae bacterium]|jgi:hypothetical protein|nr:DUF4830 domain-containing protein [Oscillospiraceae bacterium]
MIIVTAKFNRKRAVISVVALAILLAAIVVLAGRRDAAASAIAAVAKNNGERVAYLKSFGWEIDEVAIEEQDVVIPREFSDVYRQYNEIQTQQGFNLAKYGGVEAVRYTYKILNYPDADVSAVADIIVYRNEIIAGDVQSSKLDGFMHGLAYPTEVKK